MMCTLTDYSTDIIIISGLRNTAAVAVTTMTERSSITGAVYYKTFLLLSLLLFIMTRTRNNVDYQKA